MQGQKGDEECQVYPNDRGIQTRPFVRRNLSRSSCSGRGLADVIDCRSAKGAEADRAGGLRVSITSNGVLWWDRALRAANVESGHHSLARNWPADSTTARHPPPLQAQARRALQRHPGAASSNRPLSYSTQLLFIRP